MSRSILIIEDDRKIVATIKLYLEREGFVVYEANDGERGLELVATMKPELIILDLMLPRLNGMEVCAAIRARSNLPIIMLTARTTEDDKLAGLYQGADDYVAKPFSPRELVARVHAVLRRVADQGGKQSTFSGGNLHVDFKQHEVRLGEKLVSLTPKEFRLLETFVQSPGRAFTRQELVERAFGWNYDALDRTVDAHVANLRRKIQPDRSKPPLIATVFGVGYKFTRPDDDA